MTSPPFMILLSFVAIVAAGILRPQRAECPAWAHVEGRWDRCDGCYDCRPNVPPSSHEPRGHEQDEHYGPEYDAVSAGRIVCRDNEQPMIVDEHSIRCEVRR